MKLHIKKQKPILSLSEQEYTFLADLLDRGYPILDALSFLQKDTKPLQAFLQEGKAVEDVFAQEKQDRFHLHLSFFLHVSTLPDAIHSAIHMKGFEQGIKKSLLKKCSYPIFLFIFAFVIMFLFTRWIIPQMLTSFELDNTFSRLLYALQLLQNLTMFMMIVIIFAFIIYALIKPEKRSKLLYQYAHRISFIKDIISYQLAGYLFELEQKGISTKEALQYLMQMKKSTLFYYVIESIVSQLLIGNEMLEIVEHHQLISKSFQMMFRVGTWNGTLCEMLSLFMKQQEFAWDRTIRICGLTVQIVAYVFIAFLVLIVYQIMLVPLEMLETM